MNLLSTINDVSVIIRVYADDALRHELSNLQQKVVQEKLYVVVVGLFKRGKSTLINALLQKSVLPVGVTPVTALITLLEHAEQPSAEVYFKNGEKQNVSTEAIAGFVTEEDNPDNIKQVDYVKIFDNAPILQSVSLVDTPGLGSAYEHNSQTTLSFIHKIDAALFLFSADYPVAKIDLDLLKELQQAAPEIWYILTKADLVSESNLQKMIQHNKSVIANELHVPPDTISFTVVSGTNVHDANIALLRNKLTTLAQTDKTKLLQHSSVSRLKRIVSQAILQLQFTADAYLMPLHELENRSLQLAASIGVLNEQKDEFESIISGKIKLLQESIHTALNDEKNALQKVVNDKIISIDHTNNACLESLQKELDDIILSRFEDVKTIWEQKAKEHFKTLLQQYSQRSQSFLQELNANLSAYLGQNLEVFSEQFNLDVYTSFYLSLDSGLPPISKKQSIFESLFPASYQQRKLREKWQEHYKEILVHNAASIAYDLTYKIQESFRKFNYDLKRKMNDVLSSMEKSIGEVIASKTKAELQNEEVIKDITNRLTLLKTFNWS